MGTVFLRGNSWSIEYRSNNGSIRRESVGKKGIITKTMAREILRKWRANKREDWHSTASNKRTG